MTGTQKQRIIYMRGKGDSYAAIAADFGISENTVKSYCRRNNLGAGYKIGQIDPTEDACGNCGSTLEHRKGSKRRRFCSDGCRLAWWSAHPENINQKAVYNFDCAHCGTGFTAYGNKRRKYCSHGCYVAGRFGKAAAL